MNTITDLRTWITWETQRRNKELSKAFNATLKVFDHSRENSLKRYLKSAIQTYECLKLKPKIVFVQCPSIILCLEAVILKKIFNYNLVIDAHNIVLHYLHGKGPIFSILTKLILKSADFVILSNEGLSSQVPVNSEKILILPDKLPTIDHIFERPKSMSKDKINITIISSFAKDEPILEILEAAKQLSNYCKFFITGKKSKAKGYLNYQSENIIFTDYLSEQKFETLIGNSDLNIDLTTEDDLLVCGAYESLAVNVPAIISDTRIQRQIFPKGFVYTQCNRDSIQENIQYAIQNIDYLKEEIKRCKEIFVTDWNQKFQDCESQIINKVGQIPNA